MNDRKFLAGEKVCLRPITPEDTEDIIRWRNSDGVRPYFIYQKPFTREGHAKWLRDMIGSGNGYQFIIVNRQEGRPSGSVYLRDYNKEHSKIEYGIFIGEKLSHSRGMGTEALRLATGFAFEQLGIHKVFGRIFADNYASLRVSEKAGYQREALLREEVFVGGRYRDIVLVGQLNPSHAEAGCFQPGIARNAE